MTCLKSSNAISVRLMSVATGGSFLISMDTAMPHSVPGLKGPQPAPFVRAEVARPRIKLEARRLTFRYGDQVALKDVSVALFENRIAAFIGPSGCGKSTLLRVFNRMHDEHDDQRVEGEVLLDGENILAPGADLNRVRARIGMVFQIPMPFAMSIYENVAFGVRLHYRLPAGLLKERVERALRRAALWDEVKDILHNSALGLSGGQQQRLCIARALAIEPEVILFDEPCSALDPGASAKVEETLLELKADHTIAIVTHNMQQAARISDYTGFMYLGEMVEFADTSAMFTSPKNRRTGDFITGRFG
jgi:phosphate transport system ATP-binding protein